MAAVLIPLAVKFGPPVIAFAIGHVTGWFHHKKSVAPKTNA